MRKKGHKTLILLLSKCPPNFLIPEGSPTDPPTLWLSPEDEKSPKKIPGTTGFTHVSNLAAGRIPWADDLVMVC